MAKWLGLALVGASLLCFLARFVMAVADLARLPRLWRHGKTVESRRWRLARPALTGAGVLLLLAGMRLAGLPLS
ncbi:MAG: hypothetical protein AB1609_12255 [Bacillota bacterium]